MMETPLPINFEGKVVPSSANLVPGSYQTTQHFGPMLVPGQGTSMRYTPGASAGSPLVSILLFLGILGAIGLVGYGLYSLRNAATVKTKDDGTAITDIDAENKRRCKNYVRGPDNYMKNYTVVPNVTEKLRKDGYVYRGLTSFGVPHYCKINKPDKDGTIKCDESKPIVYDFGIKSDKLVMPDNFNDSRPEKFGDYYFEKSNGKINGITADEAAVECYNSESCGTVYLPACERGYRYMKREKLQNWFGSQKPEDVEKMSKNWSEASEIFGANGFKQDACVRVDPTKASELDGSSLVEAEKSYMDILDFSDVRTLNYQVGGVSERPARNAYFFKKGAQSKVSSVGSGASAKIRSTNPYGDFTLESSSETGVDHVLIQAYTGDEDQTYVPFDESAKTPCEAVNSMMPKVDKTACTKILGAPFEQEKCIVREKLFRVV